MKTLASTIIATIAIAAGSAAQAESPTVWTVGEAGLIANPAYKVSGPADRSVGIYLVGVGENELKQNPAYARLSDSMNRPVYKAGIGEASFEDQPIERKVVIAAK
jgi:hypothetical protein